MSFKSKCILAASAAEEASGKETKFLELASHFARIFSKDQSTQVGAFFLHATEFTILSAGYNGIPRGCNDDLPERQGRPLKYNWFEHAERNAIYNVVREQLRDCTVHCTAPLSIDDVRAIVSVGAKKLALAQPLTCAVSLQMLDEARVAVTVVGSTNQDLDSAVFFRANGQYIVHGVTGSSASAVSNAIFDVARPYLEGSTLAVGPLPPCESCARAVAAVGAKRVITYKPTEDQNARWGASFQATRRLFTDLDINMLEL